MLYVTTRNNRDAFTAQRALRENRASDGGFYVPLRMNGFSAEEIQALSDKTFGETVAHVLNRLFKLKLTGWDVDFCIGRYPVRLVPLRHRIMIAETWHNPQWSYERVVNNLVSHLCDASTVPGNWVRIAVRVAVLFGIFGDLQRQGIPSADISVISGDFSAVVSAWYARQWGLPIGNIICCCNENKAIWDLLCQGQMRTDTLSISTAIPEADVVVPENLERLIQVCGGYAEVSQYLQCCREGKSYYPSDVTLKTLRSGMYVSVVSSERLDHTIPGVYRTNQYILSPYAALAYAGLLDYRAKTGCTNHAIVLSEKSPVHDSAATAKAMGISEEELKSLL